MNINFFITKAKSFFKSDSAEQNAAEENCAILDIMEKIVTISREYGMDACLVEGKPYLDHVAFTLDISPLQAMLFSQFMEHSDSNQILLSEIAETVKCSKIRIIKYMNECEELEKRKLIRCSRSNNGISFRVPKDVRDSLRKSNRFTPKKNENITIFELFPILEQLFEERENNELTFNSLGVELTDLVTANMHLQFCKKIKSYNLCEANFVLLLCFCHLAENNSDDNIGFHDLSFLFDRSSEAGRVKKSLSGGDHFLIENKYIEFTNNDGFANTESWKLSDRAKKELLSEMGAKTKRNFKKNIIRSDSIHHKELYYNEKESESIKKLISLLKEENYRLVQDRLTGNGMRNGFACLFSGAPGTGKTETAYQIARKTGRNLMMVDISEIKSCWVGESEKNIKEIFDTYRNAVDNSEIAPILLLNEADAVIGMRKEFSATSRAVDQMENTIQNIILQELENLSGILIATTNLTQNMDKAFERRFLYRIEFTRPNIIARQSIWQSMIPVLSSADTGTLAGRFDLSGGQIENIARKRTVDTIISGGEPTLDKLMLFCQDELQGTPEITKKMGF